MNHKYLFILSLTTLTLIPACQGSETSQPLQCQSTAECYSGEICRHERCVLWSQELTPDSHETGGPEGVNPQGYKLPPGPSNVRDTPQHSQLDMSSSQETADLSVQSERPWRDQDPGYGISEVDMNMTVQDMARDSTTPCDGVAPMIGELVINELLMNVPTGDAGDANADGTRDAYDDEFIELVNISELALDLNGVELMVNDNVRHAFQNLCLEKGQAVVLFSGPRDRSPTWRDDVLFMAPDTKLGLSNSSGKVELWDHADRVLFSFEYEGAQKTSYVLWPELTGDVFVTHESISEELFSPGRCANTMALIDGCHELDMPGE